MSLRRGRRAHADRPWVSRTLILTAVAVSVAARRALRVVLEYAEDFIARGDIDVGFTVSGGAVLSDGSSADLAIWLDWVHARQRAASGADSASATRDEEIDVQRGFLALLSSSSVATSRSSGRAWRGRDDCRRALEGAAVWHALLAALREGEHTDIDFQVIAPK